jgi:subtilisin family serine protease
MQAWNEDGGPANAGEGVDVAIIDSGIDETHPCFDDEGYPDVQERGDTRFTNDKVIVARVFNNRSKALGLTPEATQDHGTHVAGTVACNYHTPAVVDGVIFRTIYPVWRLGRCWVTTTSSLAGLLARAARTS